MLSLNPRGTFTSKTKLINYLDAQENNKYVITIINYINSSIEYCSTIYFQKGDNYRQHLERSINQ